MTTIKERLESNIFVVVVVSSLAVGSTVAGVQQYFFTKEKDSINISHAIEVKNIVNEKRTIISDLENRLISVKRRIGDKSEYQDVSEFSITSSMVKNLSQDFTSYSSNRVFVDIPQTGQWQHQTTKKIDLVSKLFGNEIKEEDVQDTPFADVMTLPIDLWVQDSYINIDLKSQSIFGEQVTPLTLQPYLYVQVFDSDAIRKMSGVIASLAEEDSEDVDDLDKTLIKIANILESDEKKHSENDLIEIRLKEKKELIENFSNIFNEDLASVVMISDFMDSYLLSLTNVGVSFSIDSVQKQANVLYMQSQVKFREGESLMVEGENSFAVWDKETFFVGGRDYSVLIQASVPSFDGRSNHYSWIRQWLSKFRVVIN